MTDKEELVSKLRGRLEGVDGIEASYLYGSTLRSDFSEKSDIDVLIIPKENGNPVRLENDIRKLFGDLPRVDATIIFESEYEEGLHPCWSKFFFLNIKKNGILLTGKDIVRDFEDCKINFDEAYRRIVWLCQRARGVIVNRTKVWETEFWERKLRKWIPICISEILYLNGIYEPVPKKCMERFFILNKDFNNKMDIENASLSDIHNFLEELRMMCYMMKSNMETRQGVAVIIYKKFDNCEKFLLLKRNEKDKGWEFVKGGIKEGETKEQAATREAFEESGLTNVRFIKEIPYSFEIKLIVNNRLEKRIYYVVLMEAFDENFKVESNLFSGAKFLDKKDALEKMIWPEYRESLERASEHIK